MGRDSTGAACILLRAVAESHRAPIRLASLHVQFCLPCRIIDYGGDEITSTLTVISCRSQDPELIKYFALVAEPVVQLLGRAPAAAEIEEAVRRLIELFESLSRSTGRSVTGLFGELMVIHLSRAPQTAIRAWRSALDDRFDFAVDDVRVEVKAASDRMRAHYFSREQCMPPENTVGLVFSIFVERNGGGTSIEDLIGKIETQLGGNAELILRLRATVADTLGAATTAAMEMRFDEQLARGSLSVFDLRDVPGIRGELSPEVSQVHFRSDISRIAPISHSQLERRSARASDLLPG